jgi:hypothetical protein
MRVADIYSRQSVKNGKQIFALLQSLNTMGADDADQKRRNMIAALEDPVQRSKVEEGIEGQREHFDNVCKVTHISSDFKVRHSNGPNFWIISWSCILATFMELASRLHTPRTIRPSL